MFEQLLEDRSIPEPNSGCLLWTETCSVSGYGVFSEGTAEDYVQYRAHVVSYENKNGPVPDGLIVCHKCDVRCCIEPTHLYAGTYQNNHDDMKRRNRTVYLRGNGHPNSTLTDDIIRSIRLDNRTQQAIADSYGLTQSYVGKIKNRKAWSHVDD